MILSVASDAVPYIAGDACV